MSGELNIVEKGGSDQNMSTPNTLGSGLDQISRDMVSGSCAVDALKLQYLNLAHVLRSDSVLAELTQ